MKKIFISQPFHGRTEEEIFTERQNLLYILKKNYNEEIEVIDQYHQIKPEGAGSLYYISQDILMMEKADIIVFAPYWNLSRGCRIEHMIATEYGMTILECG